MNEQNTNQFNFFLKGDISGIQEFIFNVKSEGAAKSLKGRSFFIQILSLVGIEMVKKATQGKVEEFYNGGGNFYLFLEDFSEAKRIELQQLIDKACHKRNFHLTLSMIPCNADQLTANFGTLWEDLNKQSEKDKLSKFKHYATGFESYQYVDKADWKGFTRFLLNSEAYVIEKLEKESALYEVGQDGVMVFGYHFRNPKNGDPLVPRSYKNMVKTLPLWTTENRRKMQPYIEAENAKREADDNYTPPVNGGIIEFSYLSGFANLRTGTNKMGILKMDIDNLGNLFSYLPSKELARQLSQEIITPFFGKFIKKMLNEPISYNGKALSLPTFGENIYTVFTGGDDCFFVGSWDVIMEWAQLLQQAFVKQVSQPIGALVASIPTAKQHPDLLELLPIGISGGLLMLEPSYPVVRFADLAEEALMDAKTFIYPSGKQARKNKISVLGEVLRWEEFEKAQEIGAFLEDLVKHKGESRATIAKIKSTYADLQEMQKRLNKGHRSAPHVSKLFYFIRKSKNNGEAIARKVMNPFAVALIGAFTKQEKNNPMAYPLGARLAEFLTRNHS